MLPSKNRLSKKSDFDRVYKRGRRVRLDSLLFSLLRTNHEASRLGFVVSKKVSNKANRRNYLKRVMRAAFASLPNELRISYDMIISLIADANLKPQTSNLKIKKTIKAESPQVKPFDQFSEIKSRLVRMVKDGER